MATRLATLLLLAAGKPSIAERRHTAQTELGVVDEKEGLSSLAPMNDEASDATPLFAGGTKSVDGTEQMCCCLKKPEDENEDGDPRCQLSSFSAGGCEDIYGKEGGYSFYGRQVGGSCKYQAYYLTSGKSKRDRRCVLDRVPGNQHAFQKLKSIPQGSHHMVRGVVPMPLLHNQFPSGYRARVRVYLVRHGESFFNTGMETSKLKVGYKSLFGEMRDARLTPLGQDQAVASQTFFQKELENVESSKIQFAGSLLSRAYDTLVLATGLVWSRNGASTRHFRMDQVPAFMEFGNGQDVDRQRTIADSKDKLNTENFAPVFLGDSSISTQSRLVPPEFGDFYLHSEEPSTFYTDQPFQVQAGYPRRTTKGCKDDGSGSEATMAQINDLAHYLASRALDGKTHVVVGAHSALLRCFFRGLDARRISNSLASDSHTDVFDLKRDKIPNGALARFDLDVSADGFITPDQGWAPFPGSFDISSLQIFKPGHPDHFPSVGELTFFVNQFVVQDLSQVKAPYSITIESGGIYSKTFVNDLLVWDQLVQIRVTSPNQRIRFSIRDADGELANLELSLADKEFQGTDRALSSGSHGTLFLQQWSYTTASDR